jgi:hypothetical protein
VAQGSDRHAVLSLRGIHPDNAVPRKLSDGVCGRDRRSARGDVFRYLHVLLASDDAVIGA